MQWVLIFVYVFLLELLKGSFAAVTVPDEEYDLMPPVFHLDDYDRCMLLKKDALYCFVRMKVEPIDSKDSSKPWIVIEKVSKSIQNYRHDILRYGVCVPNTCPINQTYQNLENALSECFSRKFAGKGLKATIIQTKCESHENPHKITYVDIIVGIIAVVYLIFVVFASFYEGVARYKSKETYSKITGTKFGRILAAFSVPKNWYRLTTVSDNSDAKLLRSMQGIRFYNMILVIISHSSMSVIASPVLNTKYVENLPNNILNMFFLNGASAVQSFFVISGWLMSYSFFVGFENKKPIRLKHLVWALIIRYLRVTPTTIFFIALHATWLVHLNRGPYWEHIIGGEYRFCRKNWWANLLYINNYYDIANICIGHSWYLATDMQIFAVCLVMIWLMMNKRRYLKLIIFLFVLAGLLLHGLTHYFNGNKIIMMRHPENVANFSMSDKHTKTTYLAGHVNLTGYVIGVAFGYVFYKYRGRPLIGRNKFFVGLWWLYWFVLQVFIILVGKFFYEDDFSCPQYLATLYDVASRNLFALAIAVLILGTTEKIGWFARFVLEWSAVQVLGRLTFCAYLCHITLIKYRMGDIRQPVYTNSFHMLHLSIGDIVLSYLGALFLCLFIELPLSALQKIILEREFRGESKDEKVS